MPENALSQVPPPDELLIPPQEAARRLSVSPRKLWSLTQSGAVPSVRIGRSVRYSPLDLRAWIETQTKGGAGK